MFRAINVLAFIDVHRFDSQSVDYRPIVHGLIVTFTLRKSARKALDLSQEAGCGTMPAWAKAKGDTLENYRV
jgi:hypothetical protein